MVRITDILCPIDFSEVSRHAFDRAVGVARCYDAVIHVLHVLPMSAAVHAVPVGPEGPGPFRLLDADRILRDLPGFLALENPIGVSIDYHVLDAPVAHKEILVQAQRVSANLIVMGTHGRSGFERLLLGSVTEKVLRTSSVPVLTVPCRAPDAVPATRDPFRRILYATDFSASSEGALRYAASLAEHGAAKLTILHVVETLARIHGAPPDFYFDATGFDAALEKQARETLPQWVPESVRLGCDTEDLVVRGVPYAEILRVASEQQIDLIVLGVHGRNALDRLVFGSTTEQIVRRATCPVLTIRN